MRSSGDLAAVRSATQLSTGAATTGAWRSAPPNSRSVTAQISCRAASTSRIASGCRYTAARSAITPPKIPPSVAPIPIRAMWRFALWTSNRSLTIDQNPDTSTAPRVARWKNTTTAIARGARAISSHSPIDSAALTTLSTGINRTGPQRTISRPATTMIGSEVTAEIVMKIGRLVTS